MMLHNDDNRGASSGGGYSIPNIVLKSAFIDPSGFNVCHLNVRSLLGKIDVVRDMFVATGVHVVLVSETWLSSDITDNMIRLPGYKLYRNDRVTSTVGGGVAIYVRCGLSVRILLKSDQPDSIEFILVDVKTHASNVLIGCTYMAKPTVKRLDPFKEALRTYSSQYENVLIGGDFNINMINPSDAVRSSFLKILRSRSLSIVNNVYPTRFGMSINGFSSSLLDIFLVSSDKPDGVGSFGQISVSGVSDHDLIYVSLKIRTNLPEQNTFIYRDMKSINIPILLDAAGQCSWVDVLTLNNVNDQLSTLNNIIQQLYVKYVPLRVFKPKLQSIPYFSPEIEKTIVDRDIAYEHWKRNKHQASWDIFKTFRNRVTLLVRQAKKRYFSSKLNPQLPTKIFWENVRKMGFMNDKKCNSGTVPPCNELNRFFLNNPVTEQLRVNEFISNSQENENMNMRNIRKLSFTNIQNDVVFCAINSVKSDSLGNDKICIRFIKIILPIILPYITYIFNSILTTSMFPSAWKIS